MDYISPERGDRVKSYIGDVEFDVLGSGSGEYIVIDIIYIQKYNKSK